VQLAAAVGVVYRRPALLWLYSDFGADYKCPDSTPAVVVVAAAPHQLQGTTSPQ